MNKKPTYTTYTANLRIDQVEYLKSLPNASGFLRDLIDSAMQKELLKKQWKKSKAERWLSQIEERLVQSMNEYQEDWFDKEVEWKPRRVYNQRPYRYEDSIYLPSLSFPLHEMNPFIKFLKEKGRFDQLKYLKKAATSSRDERQFLEALKPVYDKAREKWLSNYPENWRIELTEEYTLGNLIERLEAWKEGKKEITIREIESILELSYQRIYNKVKPLLEAESYRFVRSKGKLIN